MLYPKDCTPNPKPPFVEGQLDETMPEPAKAEEDSWVPSQGSAFILRISGYFFRVQGSFIRGLGFRV